MSLHKAATATGYQKAASHHIRRLKKGAHPPPPLFHTIGYAIADSEADPDPVCVVFADKEIFPQLDFQNWLLIVNTKRKSLKMKYMH